MMQSDDNGYWVTQVAVPPASYCASLGLVKFAGSRFFTTELLDTLRKDNPQSLRGFALSQPAPGHCPPWGRFADALKTSERQTVAALGAEIFEYVGATPGKTAAFTEAMSGLTVAVAEERLITDGGFGEVTVMPTNTPMTIHSSTAA